MRNARLVLLLCAVVTSLSSIPRAGAAPSEVEAQFAEANAAFAAGDYDRAANVFRTILEAGHVSTALLYDLANAESKAGRPGQAVLQYERALSLAPRDPDVLANLRQTRTAANLSEPKRGRWQRASAALTVDGWAWLASAALWIACLLLGMHALRAEASARPARPLFATIASSLIVVCVAGALATTRLRDLDRAVVIGPSPGLRVAPFDSATISTELAAGRMVEIERTHDAFALVRTDDGQAGWMPKTEIAEILRLSPPEQ